MKKYSSRFKGIVFDLDNTLYDEKKYFFEVFKEFCNRLHCCEKLNRIKKSFLHLRPISKDIFWDILRLNEFKGNIQRLKNELYNIYTSCKADISLYKDARYLLNKLKNSDLKSAILTNGVIKAQKNKIRCLSISDYFDEILFARRLGIKSEKPSRKSFESVSKRLKTAPYSLIFVGDNPDTDFSGAKELGGFTVRLKRGIYAETPANEFIDMEIENLKEINI